jgi:hypothetical protein
MNDGAVDEIGQSGLIDWSAPSAMALLGKCHGHRHYQRWWLARLTWKVMLVVGWLSCWAARSEWVLPPRLRQRPPWGPVWVWPSRGNLPSTVMIVVCAGA